MDLVRIFACLCVSIVHFNATMSGWNQFGGFVYPNSIVPNYYLGGRVYLGSVGVSLFFILTGASLMLTYRSGNLKQYYKKRFLGIYPMFWIAYTVTFALDFFRWRGLPLEDIRLLGYSALGIDGYLSLLGLVYTPFYKVGEWFLGALLALYVLFPMLHWLVERKPLIAGVGVFAGYGGYLWLARRLGWPMQEHWFFLRIPELLLGMLFIKYDLRHKPVLMLGIGAIAAMASILLRNRIHGLTLCVGVCLLLFALLIWLGEKIKSPKIIRAMTKSAALTYPIFLVHHWLIDRLVIGFDVANMPKRNVVMMFLIYVFLTVLFAWLLQLGAQKVIAFISGAISGRIEEKK